MQYTLYQFAISHYCEKVRWALDYKGLDYRVKNLVPGLHRRTTTRLGSASSVPVLAAGGDAVQGSAEIISWLDKRHPERRLTPVSTEDAALATEWERSADRDIGVTMRLIAYRWILEDRALSIRLLTEDAPWWAGAWLGLTFGPVRRVMRDRMKISPDNALTAAQQLDRALDQIGERVASRRFLAGPLFSRADLAVSALLAPAWRDIAGMPAGLADFIAARNAHPAMQWAHALYAELRHSA